MKDTHLTEPDRIKSLLALLALAFCWVHFVGDWVVAQKPLEIKKHGRLAQSIFRKGDRPSPAYFICFFRQIPNYCFYSGY